VSLVNLSLIVVVSLSVIEVRGSLADFGIATPSGE